ncbi:hypothetical protein N9948_02235 [bacterium]|nr:hypothetical protein [bacterium]
MSEDSNHVTGVNTQATGTQESPTAQAQPSPQPEAPTPAPQQTAPEPVIPTKGDMSKYAGLDIGTMNIIASRQTGDKVDTKRIRDVFIDLTQEQVKMLKLSGDTSFVEKDGLCYVLGDDAANIANIFGRQLRAPLNKGVISAGEIEAMEILKVMVGETLGQAPEGGGFCFVSSPGDPIDNDFDALYHQAVVTDIVESYGWDVETASESTAMAYSECASSQFTGLNISCGHGMTNVSLVFKTIETLKFSVARGGYWLDEQTAKVTGKTPSQICAIKEMGVDLLNPVGKEQQALAVYYKHFIKYVIHNFIQKFRQISGNIALPDDIPCVIAGGTSKPKGFVDLVKQAINKEKGFPFPISEVRQAADPLNSISRGLLIMAQNQG